MSETVSVAEFGRRFSDDMDRVAREGASFVLEDEGKMVAEVRPRREGLPLSQLPAVLAAAPHLSREEADAFARDLEGARKEMGQQVPRDPWER